MRRFVFSLRFKLATSFLIAFLVVLPNLVANFKVPKNLAFVGENFFPSLSDSHFDIEGVYFSAIKQFASGNFLYQNPYDFANRRFFHYPVYLVLGKIVGFTSFPVAFIYSASTFVLAFFSCIFLFYFLKLFFKEERDILFAFLFANFGGLFIANVPESNAFLSYFLPHFVISLLALFGDFYFLVKFFADKKLKWLIGIFGATFVLVVVHPWMVVPLMVAYFLWILLLRKSQRFGFKLFLPLVLMALVSVPWIIYFKLNIFWTSYVLKSSLFLLPLLFGPLFFLAIFGLMELKKYKKNSPLFFLGIWFLVEVVFVYIPLAFQRRFAEGLFMPIAVFGLIGVKNLKRVRWVSPEILKLLFIPFLFCGITGTYIFFFWTPKEFVYRPLEDFEAANYLDGNGGFDRRVLSLFQTGNFIGGRANISEYVGHRIQTENFEEKYFKSLDFFEGKMSARQREEFVAKNRICYVFVGGDENKILGFNLREEKYLWPVFEKGTVTIYQSPFCGYK